MTLLDGEILWHLVWILPLAGSILYWGSRKRKALLQKFLGEQADDPARVNASPVLRFWRAVLFAGTVILLLVAAARPSWGTRILPYSGQGRDLMVVFDVSKSMLSQDVRPSRLDHAKWLVRQLCTRNPGDRFGLIAFAGKAFLECPLTIDQTSFLQSVDELSVDTIPVGGTNIQQALTEAIRGFRAAETTHRAVILITDGDELTGKSTEALDRIIQLKIPLFILGIGDPSQPAIVQLRDEKGNVQTLKDSSGNVVSVPLNEKMLAGLAARTGGIYVRSTTTHPGLDQIEARIKQLEKHDIDSGKQTRPIERPLYPLLGAFILFCLWLLLGERRNFAARTAARLLLICGLAGLPFAMSAQETLQSRPEEKTASPAESKKENQKENQPAALSPEELFNQGLKAQTQEKDLAKAVQLYEQVIAAANASPEVRARAAQNLGVLNHQQARAMLQQTGQSLQAQQLDPALQQTEQALKQFAVTEEIYKNSLREGSDVAPVSRNQYQLIQDRKYAEELKKKIEELKKKQQEARKNTQQAMNQQQQQNQQKQDQQKQNKQQQKQDQQQQNKQQQNQQKQDQQKQQQNQQKQNQQKQDQQKQQQDQQQQGQQKQQNQQKQDQQKQQQGQQNQSQPQNQQQTDKARESVRQLEQQAKELNQKKMEDQAKKAGEELDKARQAQKQDKNQEAEKHLAKALEHLGKDQSESNQKQNQQDQKQGQNKDQKQNRDKQDQKQDQKGQSKPDKQLPKPGQGKQQNAKPEPEKEINKDQAEALLEVMAGDEKKLKDELKARMKQNYGTRPVDKDW